MVTVPMTSGEARGRLDRTGRLGEGTALWAPQQSFLILQVVVVYPRGRVENKVSRDRVHDRDRDRISSVAYTT
jgi:hypothetical protein